MNDKKINQVIKIFLMLIFIFFIFMTDATDVKNINFIPLPISRVILSFITITIFYLYLNMKKKFKYNFISAILIGRIILSIIPAFYVQIDSYWGNVLVVILEFLFFQIAFNNMPKNYRYFLNVLILFSVIISIQSIILYINNLSIVSYTAIQYKSQFILPIGGSNYISCILLPVVIFLFKCDYKIIWKKATIVILIIGIVLTKSRTAIVILSVYFVYTILHKLFLRYKRKKFEKKELIIIAVVASSIILFMIINFNSIISVLSGYSSILEGSNLLNRITSGRADIIWDTLEKVRAHLLLGWGPNYSADFTRSHNLIIDLLYQGGIIGLFLFGFMLFKVNLTIKNNKKNLLIQSSFTILIVILIQSILEIGLLNTVFTDFIFFTLLGFILAKNDSLSEGVAEQHKYIFILRDYYPSFNPATAGLKNVIDEFQKVGLDCTVIAAKNRFSLKSYECIKKLKIYRVNDFRVSFYNLKKPDYWWYKYLYKIIKLYGLLETTIRLQNIQKSLYMRFKSKLTHLIDDKHNYTLICIGQPYEASLAALDIAKDYQNVNVVNLLFDEHIENNVLNSNEQLKKFKNKLMIDMEKYILKESQFTYILPQLKEHFYMYFNDLNNSLDLFEYPSIITQDTNKNYKKDDQLAAVTIVFADLINKQLKNTISLLAFLAKNSDIIINLYHAGDYNDEINDLIEKLNFNNIINHGEVASAEKVGIAMNSADIILSFGDSEKAHLSRKIFEYISTGKPIIYICFFKDDPNIVYLKKYKNSIIIFSDESIDVIYKQMIDFCKVGTFIPFSEVKKIFYKASPEYVAEQILNKLSQIKR